LAKQGVSDTNITWHVVPIDSSWMRDNGPIYVTNGTKIWIQNGGGGNFGKWVGYKNDNRIPTYVGKHENMQVSNHLDYIMERGNLEFNGAGTLVLNWDCQNDRNPNMTKAEHEKVLRESFGITKIIWAYGHHPEDGTTGHIDGATRFINKNTLIVTKFGNKTEKDFAVEAKKAGLNVRFYPGDPNCLVGNGFVVAMSDANNESYKELKNILKSFFPKRDIHMVDADTIVNEGGGIHCVTNDQPVLSKKL